MITEISELYSSQIQNFYTLLIVVNGLLHLIFASGVARDVGKLNQLGQKTALVGGVGWAFATLLGGVIPAAIYWIIHHSTITRPYTKEIKNERS